MSKSIFESKGFKKIMGMVYGLGASVVIVGALFKILHWAGADIMLTVGLLTEAGIFFISAFEPPHKEYDWTLVYPELAGMEPKGKKSAKGSITQQLDDMLAEAKIGPELIDSLGTGLKSLSNNVSNLTDLSNAAVATNEYTTNVQKASQSINGINESYTKAVDAMNGLVDSSEGSKEYSEQITKITGNLNKLNSIYELEIAESDNHIKSINSFVGNLGKVIENLQATETQTAQVKSEIGKLSENLSGLNQVYGNMLSAMSFNRAQS